MDPCGLISDKDDDDDNMVFLTGECHGNVTKFNVYK